MGKQIRELEAYTAREKKKLTDYHAYEPDEMFVSQGKELFSVLDYWRYGCSQLIGEFGNIAEFLVAQALGIRKAENVNYWTAYDMAYQNKRIEVKASGYVHPWNRKKVSKVRTFSIEPSKNAYWGGLPKEIYAGEEKSRQSEVYIFCLNQHMEVADFDPLQIDDWVFYVVPTFEINEYCKNNSNQKKISLNVVRKLARGSVPYADLRLAVDAAILRSDKHYDSL